MTTLSPPLAAPPDAAPPDAAEREVPALATGDHLTREEFHRRYELMPDVKKAELIEGVVYMPSPVSIDAHAQPYLDFGGWITHYCSRTPGLIRGGDATVFLDGINEPQPDVLLGIPEAAGGQTKLVRRKKKLYVDGAPEFVAEISASTVSIDLHAKLAAYQRNGVREYLVWRTEDAAVDWFALRDGRFTPLAADAADGLIKSAIFPGLWLDAAALLRGDLAALFSAVEAGCATDAHRDFAGRVAR